MLTQCVLPLHSVHHGVAFPMVQAAVSQHVPACMMWLLNIHESIFIAFERCCVVTHIMSRLLQPEPSHELKGPLGSLRRQLNQLQAPQQANLGGFARSDSTGPHTLKLLQATGSTTQLLAPTAGPTGRRMSSKGMCTRCCPHFALP